jgi:GDP-L-fucose synthase
MSTFWQDKKVLVTGGAGFIGSFVVKNLIHKRGVAPENIVIPRSATSDLRKFDNCRKAVEGCQVVIHLAASTGGIAFSRQHPASQYYDCMLMTLYLMEAARMAGVKKFVGVGNILVYPVSAPSPLEERYLHEGKVAATHLGIGLAKRDQVLLCEMFHKEYGLNAVTVLSANTYGPRDRFDPEVSHVIPAMIAKCHTQPELVVWGDGKPTRDFLYVEDVAEGILLAAEKLNAPEYYVNIASGEEISIGELVVLIARLSDFKGEIKFDVSKVGGDPRRCASGQKAQDLLGFHPQVSMEEGLRRTIDWYRTEVLRRLVL